MTTRTPQESAIQMRQMVMPHHTNPQNTIFGGTVMSWIDIAAAMCAAKHSRRPVVTVHIDSITFDAPIKLGEHVLVQAMVNYAGRTSMEIGVKVTSEDPITGECHVTTTAYLTFVALDKHGRPTQVPSVSPSTEDEKRRYENAKRRVEIRKQMKNDLR